MFTGVGGGTLVEAYYNTIGTIALTGHQLSFYLVHSKSSGGLTIQLLLLMFNILDKLLGKGVKVK